MKKLEITHTLKPLLIFSDLHLGSRQNDLKMERIANIIKQIDPCIVVFNGDTFNLPDRELARSALNVLKRSNSNMTSMYFLSGNHDPIFPDSSMLVDFCGKKIFFEHGHAYAKTLKFFDYLGTVINEKIMGWFKFDIQFWLRARCAKSYTISGNTVKMVKHLYEERQKIIEKYSNQNDYQCVVTGHTHYKEVTSLDNHVLYINTGNWETCTVIHPNLIVKQLDLKRDLGMIK